MVESRVHAGKQDKHRRYGHDTQTAELHQEDENPVTEPCERGADVDDGKPGHAHGRCRREQRLQKVDGLTRRDRQAEKYGSDGYDEQIAQHDQRNGVRLFFRLEDVFGSRVRERLVLRT